MQQREEIAHRRGAPLCTRGTRRADFCASLALSRAARDKRDKRRRRGEASRAGKRLGAVGARARDEKKATSVGRPNGGV